MFRVVLGGVFLALGIALIIAALSGPEDRKAGLVQDLGVECIGVTITVAVVDWLVERRQASEEARKMAWRMLDGIHHAVWVWQGGARVVDLHQLSSVLNAVADDDPITPFTQILFLRLGTNSVNSLNLDKAVVATSPPLRAALECLKPLTAIHDSSAHLPPRQIARHLKDAAAHVARAVGMKMEEGEVAFADRFRDPSPAKQEWRHYGTPPRKDEGVKH